MYLSPQLFLFGAYLLSVPRTRLSPNLVDKKTRSDYRVSPDCVGQVPRLGRCYEPLKPHTAKMLGWCETGWYKIGWCETGWCRTEFCLNASCGVLFLHFVVLSIVALRLCKLWSRASWLCTLWSWALWFWTLWLESGSFSKFFIKGSFCKFRFCCTFSFLQLRSVLNDAKLNLGRDLQLHSRFLVARAEWDVTVAR